MLDNKQPQRRLHNMHICMKHVQLFLQLSACSLSDT